MGIYTRPNIVTNGLVMYLDAGNYRSYTSGSANWFDLTPNTNSGSLVNTPTYSTDGPSILLNGSTQHIECKDIAAIGSATQLSVFFWVNPTSLATSTCMVAQWDYQTQGCFALQTDNATATSLQLFVAGTLTDTGANANVYATGLVAGKWYYVGFVYDGSQSTNATKARLYLNGSEFSLGSSTGTIPSSLTNAAATIKVGRFGGTLTRYFPGKFAAVKIYSRSLTAIEVAQNYNATKTRFNLT